MKKRLRKKRFLGEFRENVFNFSFSFKEALNEREFERAAERILDGVSTCCQPVIISFGASEDGKFCHGYATSGRRYGRLGEGEREAIISSLQGMDELEVFRITKLCFPDCSKAKIYLLENAEKRKRQRGNSSSIVPDVGNDAKSKAEVGFGTKMRYLLGERRGGMLKEIKHV
jgi:uncharacterized protein YggL (DUF469 family)